MSYDLDMFEDVLNNIIVSKVSILCCVWLMLCVAKVRSLVDGARGGDVNSDKSGQVSVISGIYSMLCFTEGGL